uniref:uncharacterized protein LOC120329920 isoform X1 n=1 Tax=Styela clava TaxID=7725 RepID=UPI00193A2216|nr:uncharacterized protein LOC120329920 isoform X1 [Styela clava]XP_039252659.1 uncharacterized protein LOC120329920 isoform X1 [Styela clava]
MTMKLGRMPANVADHNVSTGDEQECFVSWRNISGGGKSHHQKTRSATEKSTELMNCKEKTGDASMKNKAKCSLYVPSCEENQTLEKKTGNSKFILKISKAIARYLILHRLNDLNVISDQTNFLTSATFWCKLQLNDRLSCLSNFLDKNQSCIHDELLRFSERKHECPVQRGIVLEKLEHLHMARSKKNIIKEIRKIQNLVTKKPATDLCFANQDEQAHSDISLLDKTESYNVSEYRGQKFCECLKEWTGDDMMVECEKCNEWFHPECVIQKNYLEYVGEKDWRDILLVCAETKVAFHDKNSRGYITEGKWITKTGDRISNISQSFQNKNTQTEVCEMQNKIPSVGTSEKIIDFEILPNNVCFENVQTNSSSSSLNCDFSSTCIEKPKIHSQSELIPGKPASPFSTYSDVNLHSVFRIPSEIWHQAVNERTEHRFSSKGCFQMRAFILDKFQSIYKSCVPSARYHYLYSTEISSKPIEVAPLHLGYIKFQCAHHACCECFVNYLVDFHETLRGIEASIKIFGQRKHLVGCKRSLYIRGDARKNFRDKMRFIPPSVQFNESYNKLSREERDYGSHTNAPSADVLRKIKSEKKDFRATRYSSINLKKMMENEGKNKYIRFIGTEPPSVTIVSRTQLKYYTMRSQEDIVYFDATGSIIKRDSEGRDFQIYTLLIRNPYRGNISLPVATYVTSRHRAIDISSFLDQVQALQVSELGQCKKPRQIMIDGSMAMWNAVLKSYCGETRVDYYNRCFRIVSGNPILHDFKLPIIQNCYSHAMRAAQIMCLKHFPVNVTIAMAWMSKFFNCKTLGELDMLVENFYVVTNLRRNTEYVRNALSNLLVGGKCTIEHNGILDNVGY